MSELKRIDSFTGRWKFLSNFYPCPVEFEGQLYPSLEHAYQAAKVANPLERVRIQRAPSPGAAKRMGRVVHLRPNWDDMRLKIMRELVMFKFRRWASMEQQLLATGDALLIEGNDWGDTFWGWDVTLKRGENWLGRILMETRDKLRDAAQDTSMKEAHARTANSVIQHKRDTDAKLERFIATGDSRE